VANHIANKPIAHEVIPQNKVHKPLGLLVGYTNDKGLDKKPANAPVNQPVNGPLVGVQPATSDSPKRR